VPSTRRDLIAELSELFGGGSDRDLLERAFGPLQPIWLRRTDTVAQAVSRYRAETTGLWHRNPDGTLLETAPGWGQSPVRPEYDFAAIDAFRREAEADARDWSDWFDSQGLTPFGVDYDALAANPVGIARQLLDALGVTPISDLEIGTARLADDVNHALVARFRADLAAQA